MSTIEIAGVTLDLADVIVLNGTTVGSSFYQTLKRSGTNYQVPSDKKLVIVAVKPSSTDSVNNTFIGYGDAAVSSTTPPTGATTLSGGGANQSNIFLGAGASNGGHAIYFEVPANKYPYVLNPAASITVNYTIIAYLADP